MINGEIAFRAVLLAGTLVGLLTFLRGFFAYRKYRLLADTPVVRIRGAPMGLVQIRGRAQGAQTLLSPINRTPCHIFTVVVEEWHTDLRGEGKWKQAASVTESVPFDLVDDSGRVLVDATGAELDLPPGGEREVDSSAPGASTEATAPADTVPAAGQPATDAELLEFVAKARTVQPLWTAADDPRVRTMRIILLGHDPGGEISRAALEVWKHAEGSPEFSPSLDLFIQAYNRALTTAKGTAIPAASSQDDRDLIALLASLAAVAAGPQQDSEDEMARQAAGAYAREHLASGGSRRSSTSTGNYRLTESCLLPGEWYDIMGTCVENPAPRDEDDHNIIRKGANEPTFLISSKAQKEIQLGLRKSALGMILGGAAIAIVCLALFLERVGLL